MDDFYKMLTYSSCAELENMINEAAVLAAHARREKIGTNDLAEAVLKSKYKNPNGAIVTVTEDLEKRAFHEAGHLVASEVLCPGSVGLASVRGYWHGVSSFRGGFVKPCKDLPEVYDNFIVCLAGKAATELYCADTFTEGCKSDIGRACNRIRDLITENAFCGFGMVTFRHMDASENLSSRIETVTQALLERYMAEARAILIKHRCFLEKAAKELAEKGFLLSSDVQRIREEAEGRSVQPGSVLTGEFLTQGKNTVIPA